MTIELVKEFDHAGQVTYYVKLDDKFVSGSVRREMPEALEIYECVREKHTKARVEVLIKETI
jgi:hypothetical protein